MIYDTSMLSLLLFPLAVLLGLVAGFFDFTGSEIQFGAFLVFIFAFALGFLRPHLKTVWLFGVLVGIGVPIMHVVLRRYGLKEPNPLQINILATVYAFIPGVVGAYLAAFTHKFVREDRHRQITIDEATLKKQIKEEKEETTKETVPEFKSKYNIPKV